MAVKSRLFTGMTSDSTRAERKDEILGKENGHILNPYADCLGTNPNLFHIKTSGCVLSSEQWGPYETSRLPVARVRSRNIEHSSTNVGVKV